MKRLRKKKVRGFIRKYLVNTGLMKDLSPVILNKTRWTSSFDMLSRMNDMIDHLIDIDFSEVDKKLAKIEWTNDEVKQLKTLVAQSQGMASITLELQREDLTFVEARALFDHAMELFNYSCFREYLQTDCF